MRRPEPHTTLVRSLGLADSTLLVIGCIVGVGIFRTASSIAGHLPSPPLILALWLAGGIVSLFGALCYAELAAMFPKSGGDYIYITRPYGRFWGFLFGWTKLFVERTGTIAILGFVFAEYLARVLGSGNGSIRWMASCGVILLTAINVFGIRWGKYVQNSLTVLKIAALCSIVGVGLLAAQGQGSLAPAAVAPTGLTLWQAMGVAFVSVLWTYGGWTEAAYVAEEVKDSQRTVPRAIVTGVLLTTVIYTLVNAVYLLYIPISQMPSTPLVAAATMERAIGHAGAIFIGWMVACSAFGALNGYILTGGRILYALGQDHPLFNRLATISPRFRTPAAALWLNAAVAILLIHTKTFDQIMTYSTVVIQVFFTMAVIAVLVLRRTQPDAPRPYRVWGYPFVPIVFILVMVGFVLNITIKEPTEALFGFGLMALGFPLYILSEATRGGTGDGPRDLVAATEPELAPMGSPGSNGHS